jgi:hypothetical protein
MLVRRKLSGVSVGAWKYSESIVNSKPRVRVLARTIKRAGIRSLPTLPNHQCIEENAHNDIFVMPQLAK